MFIRVENRRINTGHIALYKVNEDGDTEIIWSHGGMTKYQGGDFAEALDAAIGVPRIKPPAGTAVLPANVQRKVEDLKARRAAATVGIEEVA